jgi:hypothetical protein
MNGTIVSVTIWRIAKAASRRGRDSLERISRRALAEDGMELTDVPPEIEPTLRVVRGEEGNGRSEMAVRARLSRRIGFGVPASDHEWPPGPSIVMR